MASDSGATLQVAAIDHVQDFVMVALSRCAVDFEVGDLPPLEDFLVINFILGDGDRVVDDVADFFESGFQELRGLHFLLLSLLDLSVDCLDLFNFFETRVLALAGFFLFSDCLVGDTVLFVELV